MPWLLRPFHIRGRTLCYEHKIITNTSPQDQAGHSTIRLQHTTLIIGQGGITSWVFGPGLCKNGEKERRVQICMDPLSTLAVDMTVSSSQLLEYPAMVCCIPELWAKETLSLKLFCQCSSLQLQTTLNSFFSSSFCITSHYGESFATWSFVWGSNYTYILHHFTIVHLLTILTNVKTQQLNTSGTVAQWESIFPVPGFDPKHWKIDR